MQNLTDLDFILRLAVGLGCGALIGVERQWRARRAGLRTNALVAAGATLFVLYSDVDGSSNSTQVAAYVVSGIGFLGGGVILRDGFNVRGLNTAATLWCTAAIGVLAASGHLAFAGIATASVLGVHLLGRPLGRFLDHDAAVEEDEGFRPYKLHITCKPKSEAHVRALIVQNTGTSDVILRGVETVRTEEGTETRLSASLLIDGDAASQLEAIVGRLSIEPGIHAVHWHSTEQELVSASTNPDDDDD